MSEKDDLTNEEKEAISRIKIIDSCLEYPINNLNSPDWNPNSMSPSDEDDLEKSIITYGFIERVIVNKHNMNIVGGNHRVKIAKERLGYTHVPVDFINEPVLAREKLLNLALNKIKGKFVDKKVNDIFTEVSHLDYIDLNPVEPISVSDKPIKVNVSDKPIKLNVSDEPVEVDITSSGFSIKEIEKRLSLESDEKGVVEDGFSDIELPSKVKLGDIWKLGNHTLMCGDSTKSIDYDKLITEHGIPNMIFTDPPYGINYGGGRTDVVKKRQYNQLLNDDLSGEDLGNLLTNVLQKGIDIYICASPIMLKPFFDVIAENDYELESVIVWDKKNRGLGYMAYRRQTEFILFIKGTEFHEGDISDVDIWKISRDTTSEYKHPTQKPIRVSARAIRNSSEVGDVVLDLFGGSGSTLMACEQMNRKCCIMELDPHFCDVIIERWEQFTGETAVLLET